MQIRTILHPTDFSESSDCALELAHALARSHGAKIVLVTVLEPPVKLPVPPVSQEFGPGLTRAARNEMAAKAAKITDVPVEVIVLRDSAGPAIVSAARDCQADVVVMSTHGRSGGMRLLMGSVAEYVLRHADCPVLTVRPAQQSNAGQGAAVHADTESRSSGAPS